MVHERTIGSKGKGLWGMKGAQLPAYIQHVYNDMVEGGKKPGSMTYRLAVGTVQNWAEGHDGHGNKVSEKTQAKAVAAVAEWEKLRAQAHAKSAREASGATEAEVTDAARRLLAALRGPSLRTRDRATALAGRLAGERPHDHAHAARLMEALADCGCEKLGGCADAPEVLAEAKMGKCPDCGKPVPEALLEKGGKCPHCGDKIKPADAEDKKEKPESGPPDAEDKKEAKEARSDSRLAPRKSGYASKPGVDASRDTVVAGQLKKGHSRLAGRPKPGAGTTPPDTY